MTYQTLFDTIRDAGELTTDDTTRVIEEYRRLRVLTFNSHDLYQIKHGAFFDGDVIRRALATIPGTED